MHEAFWKVSPPLALRRTVRRCGVRIQVRPVLVPLNPTLCAALQHHLKRLVPTRLTVLPAQRARLEKGNSVTKKSGAEQVECVMSGYKPAA